MRPPPGKSGLRETCDVERSEAVRLQPASVLERGAWALGLRKPSAATRSATSPGAFIRVPFDHVSRAEYGYASSLAGAVATALTGIGAIGELCVARRDTVQRIQRF